jgi:hypothetical protein
MPARKISAIIGIAHAKILVRAVEVYKLLKAGGSMTESGVVFDLRNRCPRPTSPILCGIISLGQESWALAESGVEDSMFGESQRDGKLLS